MLRFNRRRLFAPLAASLAALALLNAGLLSADLVEAGPELSVSSCDVHIAATAAEAAAAVASGAAPFVLPGALGESLFCAQDCTPPGEAARCTPGHQVEKVALSEAPGDFVSPPRCYAAPSLGGTRHLSGALSCAWPDDREITLQLTSALEGRGLSLEELQFCLGNKTADSVGFERNSANSSVLGPLHSAGAMWFGFAPQSQGVPTGPIAKWHQERKVRDSLPPLGVHECKLGAGDVIVIPPGWSWGSIGEGKAIFTPADRGPGKGGATQTHARDKAVLVSLAPQIRCNLASVLSDGLLHGDRWSYVRQTLEPGARTGRWRRILAQMAGMV